METALHVYDHILEVSQRHKAILLDAYGVFWSGNAKGLIPGAKQAMEQLVNDGHIVGILSNSTQLSTKEMNKLEKHGLLKGGHYHFLLTSGDVSKDFFTSDALPFSTPNKKYWLFGGDHPKFASHTAIFASTPFQEAISLDGSDFIYVSIPHINGEDQIDPNIFAKDVKNLVKSKLPMVCSNPDLYAHEGTPPRAVVRQGSIAKLYERLGGDVFYIGKPYPMSFAKGMDFFGEYNILSPHEVLMVGDTPETDILGGKQFGMHTCLLTQTGILADRAAQSGLQQALSALSNEQLPTYFIKQLGL